MNRRVLFAITAMILVATFAFASSSFGAGIKERMAERKPAIQALKAKGVIGENNQGFLEHRTGSQEGKAIVDAENEDRKKVYAHIAKQQGSTAAHVGQRRAAQIASLAKPGEWIQKSTGEWVKK